MSREEDGIQKAVVDHLRARPAPGLIWFAVQNEGRRSYRSAAWAKAMGVRAGVSDLILFRAGEFFALELKSLKGKLTPAQDEFLNSVACNGGNAAVAKGLTEALLILESWGCLIGKGAPTECLLDTGCLST